MAPATSRTPITTRVVGSSRRPPVATKAARTMTTATPSASSPDAPASGIETVTERRPAGAGRSSAVAAGGMRPVEAAHGSPRAPRARRGGGQRADGEEHEERDHRRRDVVPRGVQARCPGDDRPAADVDGRAAVAGRVLEPGAIAVVGGRQGLAAAPTARAAGAGSAVAGAARRARGGGTGDDVTAIRVLVGVRR